MTSTNTNSLSYGELLRSNRNFRNLLWGQFVSETGNWFNFIAAAGLIRQITNGNAEAAGILLACRLLPYAIISPFAGAFVDRFSRRQVMLWTDIARVGIALIFLLVSKPEDMWIAFIAMALLSGFGAFFDAGKNAATPNMCGSEGLLAGTALMFSTRFLLMAFGSAAGGVVAWLFGYEWAFIINAASFAISSYSVWLVSEESTRDDTTAEKMRNKSASFLKELKEGLVYAVGNRFALTILLMNVIWATGGGAVNIVFERMGGIEFARTENLDPNLALGILWFASGIGLFLGMMLARRTDNYLELTEKRGRFIIVALVVHGLIFASAGFMESIWLFSILILVSRTIIGVEYAVQETMFQRTLPDEIRGRVSTVDRGAELTVFGLSSYFAGLAMSVITPQTLTIISGLLSATAGLVWYLREGFRDRIMDNRLKSAAAVHRTEG
jgi:MFS family permease